MLRFDKAIYLSLLFICKIEEKSMSIRCFAILEFINLASILFYNFIESIMLLYTFLVICFPRYKKYVIWGTSISNFSDVLPGFTCARAIGNLLGICLGVNILRPFSNFKIIIIKFNNLRSRFVKFRNVFYFTKLFL